jgi:hypothetical protein
MRLLLFFISSAICTFRLEAQKTRLVDICIYGATSGAVIAAYTAARMGKTVLLVSPDKHPGGITSGGLGNTDIGNKSAITGLARDFYRRIGKHYGKSEQWTFEPHVAEEVFNEYLRLGKVEVWYRQSLLSVTLNKKEIREIKTGNTETASSVDTGFYGTWPVSSRSGCSGNRPAPACSAGAGYRDSKNLEGKSAGRKIIPDILTGKPEA